MLAEKFIVLKPDNVIIVHMVPKMLVAHVFVGAIGSTAQPTHETAQRGIVPRFPENEIVAAFVDQVSRDHHAVRKSQRRDCVHKPVRYKQPDKAKYIQRDRIDHGKAIPAHSEGVFCQALC